MGGKVSKAAALVVFVSVCYILSYSLLLHTETRGKMQESP